MANAPFRRPGVTDRDNAVPAATRTRGIVVSAGNGPDGVSEFRGTRGTVLRRSEAHLGIDRQRRQPLAGALRSTQRIAHLPDSASRKRDEVAARQPIGHPGRIDAGGAHRCWRYHVSLSAGSEDPLGDAAVLTLPDLDHQALVLQRLEVVSDLLAGQPYAGSDRSRRGRLLG